MIPFIHSRPRDFGLPQIVGAQPTFFFHADRIPGADAAAVTGSAFPCQGIPINGTQPAAPTISAAGWGGSKRCLSFTTAQYLRVDALAADHTNYGDSWLMVAAMNVPNTAAQRTYLGYGLNASGTDFGEFYLETTDVSTIYLSDTGGAVGAASAVTQTMGADVIVGILRNSGGTYSMFQLASGGETKFRENVALVKTGAVTFDRGVIGGEWYATSVTANGAGFKLRAMGVWHRATMDSTKLSALLVHFRDKLDCPV